MSFAQPGVTARLGQVAPECELVELGRPASMFTFAGFSSLIKRFRGCARADLSGGGRGCATDHRRNRGLDPCKPAGSFGDYLVAALVADYNGELRVHPSLLDVVLHDEPHVEIMSRK
jgi:hypothetical protein